MDVLCDYFALMASMLAAYDRLCSRVQEIVFVKVTSKQTPISSNVQLIAHC